MQIVIVQQLFYSIGIPCIFEEASLTPPDAHESGQSTLIVSTGLRDDIEQNVSLTLQCAIILQCSESSPPVPKEVALDNCASVTSLVNITSCNYNVSLSISSSCGESIISPPFNIQVGKLSFRCLQIYIITLFSRRIKHWLP